MSDREERIDEERIVLAVERIAAALEKIVQQLALLVPPKPGRAHRIQILFGSPQ